MPMFDAQFFQMSNAIFHYGLTPDQFTVYCYLVCCAGQKEFCWPSVKTLAACCGLSENTVRKAVSTLVKRGFIRKVATKQARRDGSWRQSNNHYYILDLPPLPRRSA